MYACREVVELVSEYLEGAMTPEQMTRFELHLNLCDGCFSFVEQVRMTAGMAGRLSEIEVDGQIEAHAIKVVAGRGRLLRRIGAWDAATRHAYGQMCFARAHELVAASEGRFDDWAPTTEIALAESARLGFIAATIAQLIGGVAAHLEERRRQSDWLVAHLALD